MKISVIVPAFNEEKLLEASLQSIRRACAAWDQLGWEHELVVCDNNSTDQTAEIARRAGARVAFEPINQISRARNTGAATATGDWLIFIDADSHPSLELFRDVAVAIQGGRYLAGGTTLDIEPSYRVARAITQGWNWISRLQKWAAGAFIFCEAAAFRAVGGFSQELYASEEIELFQRLKRLARQQGKKIVILHQHPLMTSARKIDLYTPAEHLKFLLKTVVLGGRPLRKREECLTWYDGRR